MSHTTGDAWLPFALAYGGLAQLLAAMWGFAKKNVVAATGFGTFGAFWIGLGFYILLVVNPAVAAAKTPLELAAAVTTINHDLGWILLGFAVFTTYTLILVSQTNTALFATFLLLWITLIVLCIGFFNAGAAPLSLPQQRSRSAAISAWSPRSSPGTPRRRTSRPAWAASSGSPWARRSSSDTLIA